MQDDPTPKHRTRRAPWREIAIAAAVVVGGWAAMSGVLQASLPDKAETPVERQVPQVRQPGHYVADRHGPDIDYWGRKYEVYGRPVAIADNKLSAAGTSAEDVVIYYRNDVSAANKLPATYPKSGPVGGGTAWNRDADEHQGGGGGAAAYPDDKGPLLVKLAPGRYQMLRPATDGK